VQAPYEAADRPPGILGETRDHDSALGIERSIDEVLDLKYGGEWQYVVLEGCRLVRVESYLTVCIGGDEVFEDIQLQLIWQAVPAGKEDGNLQGCFRLVIDVERKEWLCLVVV
jgi:hypothetical protein